MANQKNLSVREAARRMNYTLKYVFDLLYAGKLEGATKTRGRWSIPSAAVDQWRNKRTNREGAT